MNPILAPSMLSADFYNLGEDLETMEKNGGDWLHVDIMDGHFVPNITFGPDQMKMLRGHLKLPFDVHLMISDPLTYIPRFISAGADLITVHAETEEDVDACLDLLDEAGVKKGLAISPGTNLDILNPYLDRVDLILLMGVEPGFGGQKYNPKTTERIKNLKEKIGDRDILIEVDGGINKETIAEVSDAGCDVFVAGSAVFDGDIVENIKDLKEILTADE